VSPTLSPLGFPVAKSPKSAHVGVIIPMPEILNTIKTDDFFASPKMRGWHSEKMHPRTRRSSRVE